MENKPTITNEELLRMLDGMPQSLPENNTSRGTGIAHEAAPVPPNVVSTDSTPNVDGVNAMRNVIPDEEGARPARTESSETGSNASSSNESSESSSTSGASGNGGNGGTPPRGPVDGGSEDSLEDSSDNSAHSESSNESAPERTPEQIESEEIKGSLERRKQELEDKITSETRLNGRATASDVKKLAQTKDLLDLYDKIVNPVNPESLHDKSLTEMNKDELRAKWLEAEEHGDETTKDDISDTIFNKYIDTVGLTEDQKQSAMSRLDSFVRTGEFAADYPSTLSNANDGSEESHVTDESTGNPVTSSETGDHDNDNPNVDTFNEDLGNGENPIPDAENTNNIEEPETPQEPESPNAPEGPDEPERTEGPERPESFPPVDPTEITQIIENDPTEREPEATTQPRPPLEGLIAEYDAALDDFAKQQNIQESLFKRFWNKAEKRQDYFDARERLRTARERLWSFRSEQILLSDNMRAELIDDIQAGLGMIDSQLRPMFNNILQSEGLNPDQSNRIDWTKYPADYERIMSLKNQRDQLTLASDTVAEQIRDREAEREAFRMDTVTEVAAAVTKKQLELRIEKHPKLAKMADWIQKHPKTRIGVGLGLTAIGIAGAATFNAPIVSAAIAGKAALRAYGSYNLTRAAGEAIVSRRRNRTDLGDTELANQDMDSELMNRFFGLFEANAGTQSRNKATGTAIATVLSLTPFMTHVTQATPTHVISKPIVPTTSLTHVASLKPLGNGVLPWTYFWDGGKGVNISGPPYFDRIINNGLGFRFTGNGLGNGQGAIESVIYNGHQYTDLGHINGAIAQILGAK